MFPHLNKHLTTDTAVIEENEDNEPPPKKIKRRNISLIQSFTVPPNVTNSNLSKEAMPELSGNASSKTFNKTPTKAITKRKKTKESSSSETESTTGSADLSLSDEMCNPESRVLLSNPSVSSRAKQVSDAALSPKSPRTSPRKLGGKKPAVVPSRKAKKKDEDEEQEEDEQNTIQQARRKNKK
jgi:hypothetical protein